MAGVNTGNTLPAGTIPTGTTWTDRTPVSTPLATSAISGQPTGGSISTLTPQQQQQYNQLVSAGASSSAASNAVGLIPLSPPNPNADAITAAHTATLKALNAPVAPTNSSLGANANTGAGSTATALTPGQLASAAGGATTGPGSLDPTLSSGTSNGVPLGTLGTGDPASIASNQSASGLLGNLIGTTQTNYQTQNQALLPSVQANQNIINNATLQEQQLTGGSYSGTAADYSGRLAQLENIKQEAQGNVNAALGNVNNALAPAASALTTGIGAATNEVQAPYGTPLLNPLSGTITNTGTQGGGTGNITGNVNTDSTNFATAVMNGTMTYDQAVSSLGYAGDIGTTALNNAILKNGGNPEALQAQGAATQSNIQTGGTTGTNTASAGYSSAVQGYNSANASYQTVTAQGNTLQQAMASAGVNTAPQFVNTPVNQLANQFGSAQFTSFQTALTETQQAYTTLLGAVGAATPTVNGQAATSLLTISSTPAQIQAALTQLQNAAYNKLLPMYNLIGTYQSQLGGTTTNGTTGTTNYNF